MYTYQASFKIPIEFEVDRQLNGMLNCVRRTRTGRGVARRRAAPPAADAAVTLGACQRRNSCEGSSDRVAHDRRFVSLLAPDVRTSAEALVWLIKFIGRG